MRKLLVTVTAAALVLTGCQSDDRDRSPRPEPDPPSRSSSTRTPTPPALPDDVSPFTGLKVAKRGPVLAVKIDNVRQARPHAGVDRADLVYVEPVEAGLSRLIAVFSGRLPSTLGPVRSARESDIEILRQFGTPAFAFSGASTAVLSLLRRARVYDVSHGRNGSAYFRSGAKRAPHNLYTHPSALLARAPKASTAGDIGFRFGPAPSGGRPVKAHRVRFKAFSIDVRWGGKAWRLAMDGRTYRAAPKTVVVQKVRVRASKHAAIRRVGSPYVETVGTGRATVLRDGRAYDVTWSRPDADAGTTFRTRDGRVIHFAPGQVWVIYDAA